MTTNYRQVLEKLQNLREVRVGLEEGISSGKVPDNTDVFRFRKNIQSRITDCSKALSTYCHDDAFLNTVINIVAEMYRQDVSSLGFVRTPFFLGLSYDIGWNIWRQRSWETVFFPVLISDAGWDISEIVNWLAVSIVGGDPKVITTDQQIVGLLDQKASRDENTPIVLPAFDRLSESSLCHVEGMCRRERLLLIAAQHVEVHPEEDGFSGLPEWTSKLIDRFRPEVIPLAEIKRQERWKGDPSSVAEDPWVEESIQDPNFWARGNLPFAAIVEQLQEK